MVTPSNSPAPHPVSRPAGVSLRPINLIQEVVDVSYDIHDMLQRAPFDDRDQPKPSDSVDGYELAAGTSRARRVGALAKVRREQKKQRESKNGSPPIKEDYRAHDLAAERYRALGWIHGSEEASPDDWDKFEGAPVGAWCIITDPLDGSGPYKHTGSNFSVNTLIYKKTLAGVELRMSVVVTATYSVLVWTADGRVSYAPGSSRGHLDLRDLAEFLRQDDAESSIAIAAAKPRARKHILPVLYDDELTVYTVGGAPASVGMVAGDLSMILYPNPQTLHDAAGLPALIQLGATLIGAGGEILNPMAILALFDNPARPGKDDNDPDHKRIPPMVIVVNDDESGKPSRGTSGRAFTHAIRVARAVLGDAKASE